MPDHIICAISRAIRYEVRWIGSHHGERAIVGDGADVGRINVAAAMTSKW